MAARDRRWLESAGVVFVRQRPGSAKGVLFATIEDETGIANVVCWVKTFEKYRHVLLSSGMLGIRGRVQREGEVVHLVAHHLTDLTPLFASVGHREAGFLCRMAGVTSCIMAARAPLTAARPGWRPRAISATATAISTKSTSAPGISANGAAANILHADLDAIYASGAQLLNPDLRGKPVAINAGCDMAAS